MRTLIFCILLCLTISEALSRRHSRKYETARTDPEEELADSLDFVTVEDEEEYYEEGEEEELPADEEECDVKKAQYGCSSQDLMEDDEPEENELDSSTDTLSRDSSEDEIPQDSKCNKKASFKRSLKRQLSRKSSQSASELDSEDQFAESESDSSVEESETEPSEEFVKRERDATTRVSKRGKRESKKLPQQHKIKSHGKVSSKNKLYRKPSATKGKDAKRVSSGETSAFGKSQSKKIVSPSEKPVNAEKRKATYTTKQQKSKSGKAPSSKESKKTSSVKSNKEQSKKTTSHRLSKRENSKRSQSQKS